MGMFGAGWGAPRLGIGNHPSLPSASVVSVHSYSSATSLDLPPRPLATGRGWAEPKSLPRAASLAIQVTRYKYKRVQAVSQLI